MDPVLVRMHLQDAIASHKCGDDDFVHEEPAQVKDLDLLKPSTPGGVYAGLYEVLFRDQETSTIDVFLPDTVVYRFNRPMAWYTTRQQDGRTGRHVIMKKRPSSLKNALVLASLLAATKDPLMDGLVDEQGALRAASATPARSGPSKSPAEQGPQRSGASTGDAGKLYIAYYVSADGIRYLDRDDLQVFLLLSKEKIDGVLQQLTAPRKQSLLNGHAEMVRCSWTPTISYVERRRNCFTFQGGTMRDKSVAQHHRIETFEGSDYTNSKEAPVTSKKNLASIKMQCARIAEHFYRVSAHRLAIHSMLANVKLREHAVLEFLWADNVWISQTDPVSGVVIAAPTQTISDAPAGAAIRNVRPADNAGGGGKSSTALSESRGSAAAPLPALEPCLSLETRHKMHSAATREAMATCRFCSLLREKSEFVQASYRTLLAAIAEIWWSSPRRLERVRHLSRMKGNRQWASSIGAATSAVRLPSSPVATTLVTSGAARERGTRSVHERWRYEPFSQESFTAPDAYAVDRRIGKSKLPSAVAQTMVPPFLLKLHPYMRPEHFVVLRERSDFLEMKCAVCSECFFSMTQNLTYSSANIAAVYCDELLEQRLLRECGGPAATTLGPHDRCVSACAASGNHAASRSSSSSSSCSSSGVQKRPARHRLVSSRSLNVGSGSSGTVQANTPTTTSSLQPRPASRCSATSRCASALVAMPISTACRKHTDVPHARRGCVVAQASSSPDQTSRLEVLASSFAADWSPPSTIVPARRKPSPWNCRWSRMRLVAKLNEAPQ